MQEIEHTEEVGEAVSVSERDIVDIERVIFKEVNDEEFYVINKIKSDKTVKKYFKRMLVSVVVICIVFFIHGAGLILKDYSMEEALNDKVIIWETCGKCAIPMIASFIIFNTISLFYTFVKRQLVCLTENYYILLEAVVCDKYPGKKVHVEGKGRKKNYIVFECDQGVCSKALEVNREQYRNTRIGNNIVVLKSVTVEGYTLSYLKENEYRKIYNAIIKNSQGAK